MATLFPMDSAPEQLPPIPGLWYLRDYITPAEELELVRLIDAEPWDTTWERRRQHYGSTYGGEQRPERPLPTWGQDLAERMHREGIGEQPFDQMLINEYLPGQGISLHQDYSPFGRTVVSLSLLSPIVMDFHHPPDGRRSAWRLNPRSLLVLSDTARYDWRHGIARRKKDRWQGMVIPRRRRLSVTFRWRRRSGGGADDGSARMVERAGVLAQPSARQARESLP